MRAGIPCCTYSARKNYLKHINVGDIVVLKNDTSKRVFWKLAKVEELLLSKDGKIRACSGLQTCPQAIAQKHSTFMNANCMDSNANEHSDTVDTEKGPSGETVNRTRPRAAIDGEVIRRLRN